MQRRYLVTFYSRLNPKYIQTRMQPYLSDLGLLICCCLVFLLTGPLAITTLYWMDHTCMHTPCALFPCPFCTQTQAFTHAQISHPISTTSLGFHSHAYKHTHTHSPSFHSLPAFAHVHLLSQANLWSHRPDILFPCPWCTHIDVHTMHTLYMASLNSCIIIPPKAQSWSAPGLPGSPPSPCFLSRVLHFWLMTHVSWVTCE